MHLPITSGRVQDLFGGSCWTLGLGPVLDLPEGFPCLHQRLGRDRTWCVDTSTSILHSFISQMTSYHPEQMWQGQVWVGIGAL